MDSRSSAFQPKIWQTATIGNDDYWVLIIWWDVCNQVFVKT